VSDVRALYAARLCLHVFRAFLYDTRLLGVPCPTLTGVHQRVREACGCNVRPPVSCVTWSRSDGERIGKPGPICALPYQPLISGG